MNNMSALHQLSRSRGHGGGRGTKTGGGGARDVGASTPGPSLADASDTRLSSTGYSFPKAAVAGGHRGLQALCKELTVTPFVAGAAPPGSGGGGGPPAPSFRLWLEGPSRIYVPKYYGLSRFGEPARQTIPEGTPIALRFAGGVRPEQHAPIDAFMAAADDPRAMGGILSLPCGSGKTVIALYILARVGRKALIVVHKDFLLQQWRERIAEFLPNARVGTIKAKTVDIADKDIVIASLQSLSMKTYPPELLADFGLLIIDEVHRTGTEVFSRALHKVNVRRSLGLSATVRRKDGMTKVFEWFIGRVVYAAAKRADDVDVRVCPFFRADPAYAEEPMSYGDRLNVSRMVNNVTAYRPRTELIAAFLLDALEREPRRRALVLSDRKQHLHDVQATLEELQRKRHGEQLQQQGHQHKHIGRTVTTGMYVGQMKPHELAASQERDVILATFSFASEGFDVPGLDTLVLASPKSDIEQSVGRILRQKASERAHTPLVFDVADDFSVFRAQARKRQTFYRRQGYRVMIDRRSYAADAATARAGVAEEDDHRDKERDDDDDDENGERGSGDEDRDDGGDPFSEKNENEHEHENENGGSDGKNGTTNNGFMFRDDDE